MKREIDNSKIISEEHEKFYRFIEGLNLRLGLIKNEIKRRKKIKMSYAEKFIYKYNLPKISKSGENWGIVLQEVL